MVEQAWLTRGPWSPPHLRPVLYIISQMLFALAAAMLLPALADWIAGDLNWQSFLVSSGATAASGAALHRMTDCRLTGGLTLRQSFVLTPLAYLTLVLFGALPLYASDHPQFANSFTNAFFETMSGLTTTGATVLVGLDTAPPGLLLWRALLQWLGGIGVIGVAIAVLPALGVGGMQLFRTESSDRSEKVMPRVREIATAIALIYASLTALCCLLYWLAGLTPFEALAHGLTTVSTAGFSTSDSSLGGFSPAAQWIGTVFMITGAIPFVLYVRVLKGERTSLRDSQTRVFLGFLLVVIAAIAAWLFLSGRYAFEPALRLAAFNVVSVVTTTGYATADYSLWGNAAVGVFFALSFVGGCTGSTAGGIKVFRFEVVAKVLRSHLRHLIFPRGVFQRVYAGRPLPEDVVASVVVFFAFFFICYGALTILLMALDLDFLTSTSAAVSALANVGPGLGPVIGPAGNYSTLPDAAKWLLSFAMLLGRLDLFTVLVLLVPQFWRG
ncbi:MAG TPA: TrkH family potassium uptake protein [Mesorhizobium sp.]|jgi:trk system potassium uptake protein TrkH|nr:TrkH family potassium uptake protein [Mesorhizobium sp.]